MLSFRRNLKIVLFLMLYSSTANTHHSFAVEFTAERTIEIKGVVTEIWFRNPHVRYYVDTVNNNEIENWDVRTSSPSLLVRKG